MPTKPSHGALYLTGILLVCFFATACEGRETEHVDRAEIEGSITERSQEMSTDQSALRDDIDRSLDQGARQIDSAIDEASERVEDILEPIPE